jgi:hypothetical protein
MALWETWFTLSLLCLTSSTTSSLPPAILWMPVHSLSPHYPWLFLGLGPISYSAYQSCAGNILPELSTLVTVPTLPFWTPGAYSIQALQPAQCRCGSLPNWSHPVPGPRAIPPLCVPTTSCLQGVILPSPPGSHAFSSCCCSTHIQPLEPWPGPIPMSWFTEGEATRWTQERW